VAVLPCKSGVSAANVTATQTDWLSPGCNTVSGAELDPPVQVDPETEASHSIVTEKYDAKSPAVAMLASVTMSGAAPVLVSGTSAAEVVPGKKPRAGCRSEVMSAGLPALLTERVRVPELSVGGVALPVTDHDAQATPPPATKPKPKAPASVNLLTKRSRRVGMAVSDDILCI